MRFFSTETRVYQFLQKYCSIMLIGLIWLVLLLPVITAGASCTAMSRMMFNFREDKSTGVGLFLKTFAEEFRSSTMILLVLFGSAVVLALIPILFSTESVIVISIVFVPVVLWLFTALYVFPLNAYFSNSVLGTIKNAFLFSLQYYKSTILMLGISLLPVFVYFVIGGYIIYTVPLWIFVLFPLMEYWKSYFYLKVFYNFVEPDQRIAFQEDSD